MSDRPSEPRDQRLNTILEGWASGQRLDAIEADEVLRAVIRQPRPAVTEGPGVLPANWWSDLSSQVSAAVVLANSRPGTFPGLAASSPAAA